MTLAQPSSRQLAGISAGSHRPSPSAWFVVGSVLLGAAWLATVVSLGRQGLFHAPPQEPPLATLMAILIPPAIFLILQTNRTIRRQTLALDPVWLTAVQGLRILGVGFLFVHAYGHLPGLFAHVAGWGDLAVALLAPFVVARLASDRRFQRTRAYRAFHWLGLLDFAGAVGSGLLARGTLPLLASPGSTAALGDLPLLLIPCFAVPLWICLHIAALLQVRALNRKE